jgi:hypothetical protein
MGCGELELVHGENHHERAMELLLGLREGREKGWGLLTMLWVSSTYSSLPWYGLRKEIELWDAMCSRLKVMTWGPPPTSGKVDGAVVEVFR